MIKSNLVKIIKDQDGKERAMIRVDKTAREMMEEEPASRWNAIYWHQKYVENIEYLKSGKYTTERIGKFEKRLTYGAIITGNKDYSGKDVYLINQGDILFTGLNFFDAKLVRRNSPWVIDRTKLHKGTILLARSGVAGVGRNRITIVTSPPEAVVDSFVDILDLNTNDINPYYTVVFWKTIYGWLQVERLINGVGTVNISFDEIRAIRIPIIPHTIQSHIESEYKKMTLFHDKAMEAKRNGNEQAYQSNLKIAENMLRELIARTETVIRGERDDIV